LTAWHVLSVVLPAVDVHSVAVSVTQRIPQPQSLSELQSTVGMQPTFSSHENPVGHWLSVVQVQQASAARGTKSENEMPMPARSEAKFALRMAARSQATCRWFTVWTAIKQRYFAML
jgi:hypothetical protein